MTENKGGVSHLKRWASKFNKDEFCCLHEEMSFEQYIQRIYENPLLIRTAYQRIYDMIMAKGTFTFERYRKSLTHYNFFDDEEIPIFGLEEALDNLVKFIKGAAGGYGTEKRVLLLHGPVGSSKSTICRRLKRGLEQYSKTDEGAWYSFKWVKLPTGPEGIYTHDTDNCPMHEDPLKLVPPEMRSKMVAELNTILRDCQPENCKNTVYTLTCDGELNPRCKLFMEELRKRYDGDWEKVVNEHIVVVRQVYSEADRMGIATFQPKDEKNQDATELTGDIDYSKLPHFGKDSDPRAFSFDGEFCVGNRGVVEFIEMLKLAQEFLYDLLGASQERQIKPKKFAQISVDEAIIGHSVSGHEPICYRQQGKVRWTTLESLYDEFSYSSSIEVLAYDFQNDCPEWASVKKVTRHRWQGRLVTTQQRWGIVETTPNHAVYDVNGDLFMPEEEREVKAVRRAIPRTYNYPYCVDMLDVMPKGFLCDREGSKALKHTKMPEEGRVRSVKQRAATTILRNLTEDSLKGFLSFLVWYTTEGHTADDRVVISQKGVEKLERLQQGVKSFCDAEGYIQPLAEETGADRLVYGCQVLRDIAETLCGCGSENKRLPDFVFDLPNDYLEYILSELGVTDGSFKCHSGASEAYREAFFTYKTTSRLLAAQVGMLMTLVGKDYNCKTTSLPSGKTGFDISYIQGHRKQNPTCRTSSRVTSENVYVYDIECEGIHNFACGVGLVVCHNTNQPEYAKLQANQYMEALKDRTVKIDVGYLLRWSDEIKVLLQDYGPDRVRQHVAPHTIEIAALWAILTRLEDDKDAKLDLIKKAKLYNGEMLPGQTEDSVKELREKYPNEGMLRGISARYVQDKISNCLSANHEYINPFMVMNEIKEGLDNHSLITKKEDLSRYHTCVDLAIKELDEILKDEVRKALTGDENAIIRLCTNYIDNLMAYIKKSKVKNKITGRDEPANEKLMRSIEEKIDVPDQGVDDFRRMIAGFMGECQHEGKTFRWDSNVELKKALEAKLFEDTKDHIKLSALNVSGASVVDPDLQKKIDAIKERLVKQYGYNEKSATDVLEYVGSLFARGDLSKDE